jgi:hypothetical protein
MAQEPTGRRAGPVDSRRRNRVLATQKMKNDETFGAEKGSPKSHSGKLQHVVQDPQVRNEGHG